MLVASGWINGGATLGADTKYEGWEWSTNVDCKIFGITRLNL